MTAAEAIRLRLNTWAARARAAARYCPSAPHDIQEPRP